jgi:hypothetical protein
MSISAKWHPFIGLFAAVAAILAVAAAIADTTRAPDATASSSSAALNTTVGDSDLSPAGGLSTLPLSFVMIVR